MNITVENRVSRQQCFLTVADGPTTITEQVVECRHDEGYKVPKYRIAQLLDAAHTMNEFNGDEVFLAVVAKLAYGDDWKRELAKAMGAE